MQDTTLPTESEHQEGSGQPTGFLGLVIAWCAHEPRRVGEVAILQVGSSAANALVLGRESPDGSGGRVLFCKQRPRMIEPTGELTNPRISRKQIAFRRARSGEIEFENLGQRSLRLNGRELRRGVLSAGDILEIGRQMVFVVAQRAMNTASETFSWDFDYGKPDPFGIVGESSLVWRMRERIAHHAAREEHLLVTGATGTGKELAVRAIHQLSSRRKKPMVAYNAAALPETLLDAELYGNAKNFPNPGMPERKGMIGESDKTILFLDEVGALAHRWHAHLLRVLDDGTYHRLGETKERQSDFRLVAAMNQNPSSLKQDFLARLTLHLHVPDLEDRVEDIPLLASHLLQPTKEEVSQDGELSFTVSRELMLALLNHAYSKNIRELKRILLLASEHRKGELLPLADEVQELLSTCRDRCVSSEAESSEADSGEAILLESGSISPELIQAKLDENNGSLKQTWQALGLKNRHVLARLIRRHGLVVRKKATGPD